MSAAPEPVQVAFPYEVRGGGRTRHASEEAHVRQLIEQVLFTMPGERVNRPDFGTGVQQLVFTAPNEETVAAVQFLVEGALQRWLADVIELQAVRVAASETPDHDGVLLIEVTYRMPGRRDVLTARLGRSPGSGEGR